MKKSVTIYDSTLRDGTQAENFNLSVDDRIRIALKIDELGIDFLEGGWPGSNPSAVEFFKSIQNHNLKHSRLTAFGSTRNFNNPVDKDPNLLALIDAKTTQETNLSRVLHGQSVSPLLHLRLCESRLVPPRRTGRARLQLLQRHRNIHKRGER